MTDFNPLEPKQYLNEDELDKFNKDMGQVLICDYLPPEVQNTKLTTWKEAEKLGYQEPTFFNADVAVYNPLGDYEYNGSRYSLIPILVHHSFREN